MRFSAGTVLAVCVASLAAAAPIVVSVDMAWKQGISDENSRVIGYGNETLHRFDETAGQIWDAVQRLERAHLPPCSAEEIDLMRHIALTSSYVQGLGRIGGNSLLCTSFGTTRPIPVGPPDLRTASGALERLGRRMPLADDHPLDIFETHGLAFLIDPGLALDIPTDGPQVSITVYVPSSPGHAVFASRNLSVPQGWYRPVRKGETLTFRSNGYLVAIVRSARFDLAAISAAPESYARQRVSSFAFVFVPLGLICAAGLAWAVAVISRRQLSLTAELRRAARRKDFFVDYQAIVDLQSNRVIGAEALVRWRRRNEIITPDTFIAIAEQSGVIRDITRCVSEIVASELPTLLNIDPNFLITLNVAAEDLRDTATVETIRRLLSSGVQPHRVALEATERVLIQANESRAVLDAIRSLGVKIAIDDFGIGYSSLSRLQSLAPDTLKIDRSFIEMIGTEEVNSRVIPHIIDMAHTLKLEIIAEGIESEQQAAYLRARGVLYAQGYLYGTPTGLEGISDALRSAQSSAPYA